MKKLNISNIILFSACFLLFSATLAVGIFLYFDIFYTNKFLPNFKVAGIKFGGKNKEEAKELLVSKIQEWDEQTLKIQGEGKSWEIPNKELGFDFNTEEIIESTFKEGKQGNLFEQFINRLKIIFISSDKPLVFSKEGVLKTVKKISEEADVQAVNTGLKIEEGKVIETGEKPGKMVREIELKYDILDYASRLSSKPTFLPYSIVYPNSNSEVIKKTKEELSDMLGLKVSVKIKSKKWEISQNEIEDWVQVKSQEKESIKKEEGNYQIKVYLNSLLENFGVVKFLNDQLEIKLKREKVSDYLEKIAQEVDKAPKSATLGIQDEKVVVLEPSKDGESLDLNNSVDRILNSLKKKETSVTLALKTVPAKVREDNIQELGIVELIGRGQSDFSGSSSSRRQNITVGTSKFNGVLVAPKEEFSFNEYLGPVDASGGFLPELVIKPGKLVKEYGGGVCQVSTTAFRAILLSSLPVTERKAHSFAVKYYLWPYGESGVDATVYQPRPDLRFKNDTGKYILIQTSVSGNKVTFDFYGTKGTKRAEIVSPQVIERGSDGSLKTVFYRNIYEGDKLIKKDTFYSSYRPASEFPREGN